MGFRPSKADFDLLMKPQEDHYEYIATYVDDIMVFSRDPIPIIKRIRVAFDLKGVDTTEYYLGGNFHIIKEVPGLLEAKNDDPKHHLSKKGLKERITMAFSARTYIENAITRLEKMLTCTFSQYNTPMSEVEHPELDDSPLLSPAQHSKYRTLIGFATWIVTLGCFDIAYEVNTYARFSQALREGHLVGLKIIFSLLKEVDQGHYCYRPKLS